MEFRYVNFADLPAGVEQAAIFDGTHIVLAIKDSSILVSFRKCSSFVIAEQTVREIHALIGIRDDLLGIDPYPF